MMPNNRVEEEYAFWGWKVCVLVEMWYTWNPYIHYTLYMHIGKELSSSQVYIFYFKIKHIIFNVQPAPATIKAAVKEMLKTVMEQNRSIR